MSFFKKNYSFRLKAQKLYFLCKFLKVQSEMMVDELVRRKRKDEKYICQKKKQ